MDYIKYWVPVLAVVVGYLGMITGGVWVWSGFATLPLLAVMDSIASHDLSVRNMKGGIGALLPLWLSAIGPVGLYIVFAYSVNLDDGPLVVLGAVLSLAWLNTAPLLPACHELFHRRGAFSRALGRYCQVGYFDPMRDIAHVVGHHIDVATYEDDDTSRRGETLYFFALVAIFESVRHSIRMECQANEAAGKSGWSIGNRLYRSVAALIVFNLVIYFIGGVFALGAALSSQLIARFLVEAFNYFQHYGVVRISGEPIERRHLWNHHKWFSRVYTFEITNHAEHHLDSYKEYYKLVPDEGSIRMPSIFICFFIGLVPPLWEKYIIRPSLQKWDDEYASEEERAVAKHDNKLAGWS
ncbi:MAG: hypothetical protein ACJA1I_000153 [Zhongshania marina]